MYDKAYFISVHMLVYYITLNTMTVLEVTDVVVFLFNRGTSVCCSTEHSARYNKINTKSDSIKFHRLRKRLWGAL
jgi:hypothetical protein